MRLLILATLSLFCALVGARAQDSIPQVLARIDSFSGTVLLNKAPATARETFPAAGSVITTGLDGYASVVFSNGLVVYCGPSSQLTVKAATQLEYLDTYLAAEFENTRSDIVLQVQDGRYGFVQPEPDPTSKLEIQTRFGSIEGDATRFAIVLSGGDPIAAAIKGNLYYLPEQGARRFIAEGEGIDLHDAHLDNTHEALVQLRSSGSLQYFSLIEPAQKSALRTVLLVEDGQPVFRTAVRPVNLKGAALNDYRLSE